MRTGLVIEDNEDNMVLITRLLEKSGYHTLRAETGKKGVEMALEDNPDFIILDIQLPDINGTEVLKLIRQANSGGTKTDKKIPIIAMTSFAMAGDRKKLLAAGCDGYIEKPIDPDNVISRIKQITGEKI